MVNAMLQNKIANHPANPVIIAYAEGRKNGCSDYDGQHDIVAKRSTSGGASWGALQVADAAGGGRCGEAVQLHGRGDSELGLVPILVRALPSSAPQPLAAGSGSSPRPAPGQRVTPGK